MKELHYLSFMRCRLRRLLNQLEKCLVWGSVLGSLAFGTALGNSSTPSAASFLPVCYSTPNRMASAPLLRREAKWLSSTRGPGHTGPGSLSERNALVCSLPRPVSGSTDFAQHLLPLQLYSAGQATALLAKQPSCPVRALR